MQARKPVRRIALYPMKTATSDGVQVQGETAFGRVGAIFTDVIGIDECKTKVNTTIDFELFKVKHKDGLANVGEQLAQSVCLHTIKVVTAEISHDGGVTNELIEYELDKEDKHVLSMALAKAFNNYPDIATKPIIAPDRADLVAAGLQDPCDIQLKNNDDYDFACRLSTSAEGELTVFLDGVAKTKVVFEATFKEQYRPAKYVGRVMTEERIDGLVDIVFTDMKIGSEIEESERHIDADQGLYHYTPSKAEYAAIEKALINRVQTF